MEQEEDSLQYMSSYYYNDESQQYDALDQQSSTNNVFTLNYCPESYLNDNDINIQRQRLVKYSSKERPYPCTVCPYRAVQKSHLEVHMKIHAKKKPFACHLCTYRATQKYHLEVHIRNHTGEKPFGCNLCEYKTARKSDLKIHVQNRHMPK